MKTLTVITTTYNRAYCLWQVYDSLCRQTSKDFVWMIVDDGSTDSTKELADKWIKDGIIEIEYYYKPNGGMHTARNLAYEKVLTELNVIIDSDDWMTDDGVEKITKFWKENKNEKYYGIIAENISAKDGKIIGSELPKNIKHGTTIDIFGKYKASGDKKIVLRSDLSKLNPFPEFPGEKFYPASYKYILLDKDYELLILNEAVCVVDYNEDSMTYNKFAQYKSCSKGFAHYRNERIKLSDSPKLTVKHMIHYIAESKLAGNDHYIKNSAKPGWALLCLPVGLLYYVYLTKTNKKY